MLDKRLRCCILMAPLFVKKPVGWAITHPTKTSQPYWNLQQTPIMPDTQNSPDTPDWRQLYPFESHSITLGPLKYHYLDEGAGQPLLMVHGNPTWSFYWRNLVKAFSPTHRTIVPDHIGCGLSDKPTDYPYTLAQHIENLSQLIEELDLRNITLLCHDWGGAIGLGTAIALKQRFSRLIIFNTGAFPPPFIPFRIRICRTPVLGKMALCGANLFARAATWMAVEHHDRMTPAVKAGLLAPYDNWNNRTATWRFVKDIPMTRRHPTWATLEKIEQDLPTLADLPIQMIWGMKDWCFTPECLDRFAKIFPNAAIERFDDAGHYVIEDAHERIIPVVQDFLERNPTAP